MLAMTFAVAIAASESIAAEESADFFFVHLSDVHTYRHSSQVMEHYGLGPRWMPRIALAFFALRDFERVLLPHYSTSIVSPMRKAMGIDPSEASRFGLWDARSYFDEVLRPGSALGDAQDELRSSFAEVHALAPAFVINTGDIVLDSGKVPKSVSADWMRLYREVSEAGEAPIYNTIGNHELGLVARADASVGDPLYGPGFFRRHFGSSTYSFDRGSFHFVALDTHSPDPSGEAWRFDKMRPEVKAWLAKDLRENRDRVVVLLNHEPFFRDQRWTEETVDDAQIVDDEGLLERFAVAYTLTGHIHLPGSRQSGETTHIATGALSGMHWMLPPEAAPRGYRLFYARGGELFSAWKQTGKPVLGFIRPQGPGDHFPASRRAPLAADGTQTIVAVAADSGGPFARVALRLDGEEVAIERWGDYFLSARVRVPSSGATLILAAETASGTRLDTRLEIPARQ